MDVFEAVLAESRADLGRAAVLAAREIGLSGSLGRADLARSLGAVPHKLDALLGVLEVEGLAEVGPEEVRIASLPEVEPLHRRGWERLAEVVRGGPPLDASAHVEAYARHLDQVAREPAAELAALLAPCDLVLDLGGGLGAYGLALVEASPGARLTLVEAPEVARLAGEQLGDREDVEIVPADLLDVDLPCADLVLLVNTLHLFGPDAAAELVRRAAAALEPGGRLVVKDLRREPGPLVAYFDLNLALYTEGGRVHGLDDLERWTRAAGLAGHAAVLGGSPASAVWVAAGARDNRRWSRLFARGEGGSQ